MNSHSGGQSSHTAGHDRERELASHWRSLPVEALRAFTTELCAEHTYRGVAAITGLSKEGLRRFVAGETYPNLKTRQALGEIFLDFYPSGAMETTRPFHGEWQLRRQLIDFLVPGEEAARAELAKVFELAKRFPDEVPPTIDNLHEWMDLQVQGEYWAHRWIDSFGFRRKRPGTEKRPRKQPRKSEAQEEADE